MSETALEAIVLSRHGEEIRHLFAHGRETIEAPWDPDLDPTEAIVDAVAARGLVPLMVHSTSWRVVGRRLLLTFLVVIDAPSELPAGIVSESVARADLARGHATGPPAEVHITQVVEHGLRHLAWLLAEDDAIDAALPRWGEALAAYAPEPFRALGRGPDS